MNPNSFTRLYHITFPTRIKTPTLNSSLGTDSRSQTQGAGHEVGEDLVGSRGLLGLVFAEIGDLQGRVVSLGGAEGAFEGRLGGISDSPPLLAGGDGGAAGGHLLAGAGAQQSAGSGGDRHDESSNRQQLRGGEGRRRRWGGEREEDGGRIFPRLEVEVGGPAYGKVEPELSLRQAIGITGRLIGCSAHASCRFIMATSDAVLFTLVHQFNISINGSLVIIILFYLHWHYHI